MFSFPHARQCSVEAQISSTLPWVAAAKKHEGFHTALCGFANGCGTEDGSRSRRSGPCSTGALGSRMTRDFALNGLESLRTELC